jgi:hypothetical protein
MRGGSCRQSAQPASHPARWDLKDRMPACFGASVRPYNASPPLGCATRSVGASRERTIEQCSPSCSTTALAQQYGARASAQVACGRPIPSFQKDWKAVVLLRALGENRVSARLGGRVRMPPKLASPAGKWILQSKVEGSDEQAWRDHRRMNFSRHGH